MERQDISRLRKNRAIYLKLGFILALGFVIGAFSYTEYYYENFDAPIEILENNLEDIAVIRTAVVNRTKQLPPPVIRVSETILIEETPEFTELIEPEITTDMEVVTTKTKNIPAMHFIVDKIIPPPPPPPAVPKKDVPEIFKIVEKMPVFGNCDSTQISDEELKQCSDQALLNFIGKGIRYPRLAKENNIEGVVFIRFIINELGEVIEPEIVRDIGGGCGKEALRVIRSMPNWIAGQQRTQKVKVQMTLPVKFQLR